jgi:hypothetical protein
MTDDGDDLLQADQYLLDVINALHDNGEGEGDDDEPMGKQLTPSGQAPTVADRTGFDAAPRGMGLDRGLQGDPEYPF